MHQMAGVMHLSAGLVGLQSGNAEKVVVLQYSLRHQGSHGESGEVSKNERAGASWLLFLPF